MKVAELGVVFSIRFVTLAMDGEAVVLRKNTVSFCLLVGVSLFSQLQISFDREANTYETSLAFGQIFWEISFIRINPSLLF